MTTTEIIDALGLAVTVGGGLWAYRTYLRAEEWKQAEFLALRTKEFFDDQNVRQALTLIDWGGRSIQLLDPLGPKKGYVWVTRQLQTHALLPHTLVGPCDSADRESAGSDSTENFTPEEAAIRDRYDAFLDGLERFAGYVESGLMAATDLRPYLGYWIDEIHAPTKNVNDAEWCAALLTYVHFYRFTGVQHIFKELGRDIAPTTPRYQEFLRLMRDQVWAAKLAKEVNVVYPV